MFLREVANLKIITDSLDSIRKMKLKRKLSEMSEEKSEENVGTIENVVEKKEQGSIASFFTKTTTKKRKSYKNDQEENENEQFEFDQVAKWKMCLMS